VKPTVFLTGASGFVGSHVLRELLDAGYRVRALARGPLVRDDRVEIVTGDLRSSGAFARALDGCRYLIHCAAHYSFAARDRASIHAANVTGTEGLLLAAHLAGVERVVVTSSSAAIGHARGDRDADERDYPLDDRNSPYHQSKLDQERAAFASRAPVIALLPTAPVGPGDVKPTPTGKLVLDFALGKIFAKSPGRGGMNLVPVEDVARAHVTALGRGRIGERYVLGGENHSMDAIWAMLAAASGVAAPRWRVPYAVALGVAYADDLRCRLDAGAQPFAPLEGVRMSRERMYASSSKARAELGFSPGPVAAALDRAVAWYRANGYLRSRGVA
jgi:dihydroflavonol-4-reductase